MTAHAAEFFSMNDVNRLRILQDVIDHLLTTRLAVTRLEISHRHCRRLLKRYREHGPLSLVNRRRGQPGNRQLILGLAERALRIIRERYADFGSTLACEKLAEIHGLFLAKETVRKLMTQAGCWQEVLAVQDGCGAQVYDHLARKTAVLSWAQMQASGKDDVNRWNHEQVNKAVEAAGNAFFYGVTLKAAIMQSAG